ncbi:MAG: hypothetical protein CMH50_11510, partial [Myxococcales bacterium]|nr:hypothetical protein [Myxococcales bacterium]
MRFFLFILLSVLGLGCSDLMAPISSGASPCQVTTDCEEGQLCSAGACLIQEARCDLDGLVEPGEACDDGNQEDDDSCRGDCQIARCGDGIRRTDRVLGETGYEACDDGNQRHEDACANNCQNAFCG